MSGWSALGHMWLDWGALQLSSCLLGERDPGRQVFKFPRSGYHTPPPFHCCSLLGLPGWPSYPFSQIPFPPLLALRSLSRALCRCSRADVHSWHLPPGAGRTVTASTSRIWQKGGCVTAETRTRGHVVSEAFTLEVLTAM